MGQTEAAIFSCHRCSYYNWIGISEGKERLIIEIQQDTNSLIMVILFLPFLCQSETVKKEKGWLLQYCVVLN